MPMHAQEKSAVNMNRQLIGTDRIANRSLREREISRVQKMHKEVGASLNEPRACMHSGTHSQLQICT